MQVVSSNITQNPVSKLSDDKGALTGTSKAGSSVDLSCGDISGGPKSAAPQKALNNIPYSGESHTFNIVAQTKGSILGGILDKIHSIMEPQLHKLENTPGVTRFAFDQRQHVGKFPSEFLATSGVCNGLSSLWCMELAEGKSGKEILEQVSQLPKKIQYDDLESMTLASKVANLQNGQFGHCTVDGSQADIYQFRDWLEVSLSAAGFNISNFNVTTLGKFLNKASQSDNCQYLFRTPTHTMGIAKQGDLIHFFDPNYGVFTHSGTDSTEFLGSVEELIKEHYLHETETTMHMNISPK